MTSQTTAPATAETHHPDARVIIAGGLAVGAVLGYGGNFAPVGPVQDLLYALSAAGLVLGAVLLAVEHAVMGHLLAAAGFVILALGEARLINPTDAPGAEASFAAGVLLYVPALLLIATSPWAPRWTRAIGALAAVAFAVHAVGYFGGASMETDGPVVGVGYTLLTVAILGWLVTVLRSRRTTVRP
jgi:hypothetical protein